VSEVKVNKISPRSGTNIELGDSGDTIQLGGNLDVNAKDIVSTSNANIDILPNGTGKTNFGGTTGIVLPSGTTAQRVNTTGLIRFNSTTGLAEYYDGTSFKSIDAPPVNSSVSPTEVNSNAGGNQTIVITGSGFNSGATVTFLGNSGTNFDASTVTVNSETQITAVAPKASFLNAQEPYGVKVTNTSGLSATLASQINVDNAPNWQTASGNIGSVQEDSAANLTVSATDPEGDTVAYSETTSVLSGAGFSLNSSSGAITGTAAAVSADTTNTFTLRATAGGKTADRQFNIITTNDPIVQANLNYDFRAADYSGSAGTLSSGTNVGSSFGSRSNHAVFSGNTVTSYGNITFGTGDSYAPSGKYFSMGSSGVIQIKAGAVGGTSAEANYNTYFNSPSNYTWVMWFDWGGSSRQGFYSRFGSGGDTDGSIEHFNHMMDSSNQFHYNQSGVNVGSGNKSESSNWQITSGSNQWQLIHVTYEASSGSQKWYIDGSLWGSASLSTNSGNGMSGYNNNQTPHTLGGRTDNVEKFNGNIAEARTYRSTLTASQISAEWNGTKANYGRS